MPNFTAGTSFTDGVTNDVTAAKLNALIADAVPTSSLSLNSTTGTIANFTSSTANITLGTIPTLTSGTTTGTAATFTSGTITTGVIPTLTSTTLITSGTGTAASPAIQPAGDTNTGIFFPAADTIAFSEGGTESMRIDSSGNVGIGVSSPLDKLDVSGNLRVGQSQISSDSTVGVVGIYGGMSSNTSNSQLRFFGKSVSNTGQTYEIARISGSSFSGSGYSLDGGLQFSVASNNGSNVLTLTERLRIDSSGNLNIGSYHSGGNGGRLTSDGELKYRLSTSEGVYGFGTTGMSLQTTSNHPIVFGTNNTERLRITSGGNILAGTTDSSLSSGVGFKIQYDNGSTLPRVSVVINATGDSNYHLYNTNATYNGYRFYVSTNGGIANYSANNSNLSDARLKTDIVNAGDYLEKICSIPVRTFKYKDQGEDNEKTVGIIAQEVEQIIPELINNDGFGETPSDGIPYKTIYQTDLQYVLMRCIQELKSENDSLKTRIAALEAA